MFYVLRSTLGGPPEYLEYCYQEVVKVLGGVVTTQLSATSEQLQSSANFVLLGTAESEEAAQLIANPPPPPPPPPPVVATVTPKPTFGAASELPKGAKKLAQGGKKLTKAELKPHIPWAGDAGVKVTPRQG